MIDSWRSFRAKPMGAGKYQANQFEEFRQLGAFFVRGLHKVLKFLFNLLLGRLVAFDLNIFVIIESLYIYEYI